MIFYIILFLIILGIVIWGGVTQWRFVNGKEKEGYDFGVAKLNKKTHSVGGKSNVTRQTYLDLWNEAKNRNYTDFYNTLSTDFDCNIMDSKNALDAIALDTQITIKGSKMLRYY